MDSSGASVVGTGIAGAAEASGSIISSLIGAHSAQQQMKFQQQMSSTAHQREVKDLRAAGLNPILSATGGSGASTPMGTSFTPDNPLRGLSQNYLQSQMNKAQIEQAHSAINLQNTQSTLNAKNADLLDWDKSIKGSTINLIDEQRRNMSAQVDQTEATTKQIQQITQNAAFDSKEKAANAQFWNTLGSYGGAGAKGMQFIIPLIKSIFNK